MEAFLAARRRQEALREAVGPPPWSPCSALCPLRPVWASRTPFESASPPRAGTPVSAQGLGEQGGWRDGGGLLRAGGVGFPGLGRPRLPVGVGGAASEGPPRRVGLGGALPALLQAV